MDYIYNIFENDWQKETNGERLSEVTEELLVKLAEKIYERLDEYAEKKGIELPNDETEEPFDETEKQCKCGERIQNPQHDKCYDCWRKK